MNGGAMKRFGRVTPPSEVIASIAAILSSGKGAAEREAAARSSAAWSSEEHFGTTAQPCCRFHRMQTCGTGKYIWYGI
jgi:hypothetical protein